MSLTTAEEEADFQWLAKLDTKIIFDNVTVRHDALMLSVEDINKIRVAEELVRQCEAVKESTVFRKKLIRLLQHKRSSLGAYALLNQLFPDQRLVIPAGSFAWGQEKIQIHLRSKTHVAVICVSRKMLFTIAQDYWKAVLLSDSTDIDSLGAWCITHEEAEAQKNNSIQPDFPDFRPNTEKRPSNEPW